MLIHKQERNWFNSVLQGLVHQRHADLGLKRQSFYQALQCDTKTGTISSSRALVYDLSVELLRAWHGKSSKSLKKKPQKLWHLLPLLKEPVVGRSGAFTSLCFLILWAFTRICISEKTGEHRVSAWQSRWMHIENNLLHVLSVSPYSSGGFTSMFLSHLFRIVSAIGAVQRTVRHWGKEGGWSCKTVFVCAKAMCRRKQGMLQIPSFGRERVTLIVLWVLNIPVFTLKLFFINLFGLSVSDFELIYLLISFTR